MPCWITLLPASSFLGTEQQQKSLPGYVEVFNGVFPLSLAALFQFLEVKWEKKNSDRRSYGNSDLKTSTVISNIEMAEREHTNQKERKHLK